MNDRISELKQEYFKVSQAKRLMLLCLALAVLATVVWSLNIGPSKANLKTVWDVLCDLFRHNDALTNGERVIILRVRLPRICGSILAGILLACSGLLMQGVFQNPLVSPYTMGVSNGASFGASIAIVFAANLEFLNLGDYLTPVFAFAFAAFTMFLVQGIGKIAKNSTGTLLLAGVAVGHLFTGLVSLMKYMADEDKLPDLVFWQMGSVSNVTWPQIAIMAVASVLGVLVMTRYAWDLNVMATGDLCRSDFGGIIQVGIDVAGGGNIAVTQPFLDVFKSNAVGIEQAGAAVPKVMETDAPQPAPFQKVRESLCEIVRLDKFAHLVHIHIVQIVLAIAVPADPPIGVLFVPHG